MVKIRLLKQGSKHDSKFRIVAADARSPRDGKYIEIVGRWEPKTKILTVNKELILKWLNNGAQPSETVKNLIKGKGIWSEFMKSKSPKKKKKNRNKNKKTVDKKNTKVKKPISKKSTVKTNKEITNKSTVKADKTVDKKPLASKEPVLKKAKITKKEPVETPKKS